MTCFHPLKGVRYRYEYDPTRIITTFKRSEMREVEHDRYAYVVSEIKAPCGQCIGCRLEKSRQWAMRCVSELQMHAQACFLTLTYNNENLPEDGSVSKKFFKDWLKKFRESIRRRTGDCIRFFACGEYGSKFQRPHYHVIIFGFCPNDLQIHKTTRNGDVLYVSEWLKEKWPYGFHTVGKVTFESCAYVARYCTKKYMGKHPEKHYGTLEPEFVHMSRRNGIGYEWFKKFHKDVFPNDVFIFKGKTLRPPTYFDHLLKKLDFEEYHEVKLNREEKFLESPWALLSDEELQVDLDRREKVLHERFKKYMHRNYEESLQC